MSDNWTNLARIVTRRTYCRQTPTGIEDWNQVVERYVAGNVRGHNVPEKEIQALLKFGKERKAIPAGRGLWFSGSEAHTKLGGTGVVNCWFTTAADWQNYVFAQDMLMLGGGVGLSVEQRYTSKLPKIRKGVTIEHRPTKDTTFIIPDTREGWCELTRQILESFFVSGRSFSYSTVCLRGHGEPIRGFGGTASGPLPVIRFVETLCGILKSREGSHIRPIDAADILTSTAELVVAGNVRRSAVIILGDPWDKDYLKVKRWDLGQVPPHRANANYSVVVDDADDLHPNYWKTFEAGEAFGIFNRTAARKYGRMGESRPDKCEGINPCGEATLEDGEPCNLLELALLNLESPDEFEKAARLMFRYGKRVTMDRYFHEKTQTVIARNRRIGVGITGCLASPLFIPEVLDRVYAAIQDEDRKYSKELKIPESIRTTVIKPSGTVSKLLDMGGFEGIHPAFSKYIIQRVRFASDDPIIPLLKEAGHQMEPVIKFDGSRDQGTLVVDFYQEAPPGPVADAGFDTWEQLKAVKLAQKHWADQSVSASVYYNRSDIPELKSWLAENISEIKSISFLAHSEHGFLQAPKEAITAEQYEKLSARVKPIDFDRIGLGELESQECDGGYCPVK